MRTTELAAALDAELHVARFADGQENGLQVEGRADVSRVVGAVSVNRATIEAAADAGADALVTHHGLLWRKDPLYVRGVRRARLARLLGLDLNLLTYHLPLDAHPTLGNNAALADMAGCTATEPAFPLAPGGPSIGCVGTRKAEPFADWVRDFEGTLRRGCDVATGPFQVWPHGPEEVRRIGFLSGAAAHQVADAAGLGCDVFVTGETAEAAYHVAREAGIHVVAAGHYLTERAGVQRLLAWMGQRFGLEQRFVDVETLV